MAFLDSMRLALTQIRVQKLKSFFTLVGVVIGVMFLITVVSIVEGMSSYMEHDFVGKLVGVNTMTLKRYSELSSGNATVDEWRAIQRRPWIQINDVKAVADALPPEVLWSMEGDNNVTVSSAFAKPAELPANAVDGDYFKIRDIRIQQGRAITPQELELGASVVVVGAEIAKRYFPKLNAVGRNIKMAGLPYTVVGVAEPQGSVFGVSMDRFLIAPFRSPLRRSLTRPHVVDAMMLKPAGGVDIVEVKETVRQVMRSRRHLRPSQPDNFTVETSESALAFWMSIKGKLVIAGVVLPAVGLIVGALVIMNIMLVAVSERTREIGIRKALGARRRDIMAQFLIEAATLSTLGAAVGILLGITLAQIITRVSPLPASVAPWSIVAGMLVGAGVGIVSGVYPASRASRLDPIIALRQD